MTFTKFGGGIGTDFKNHNKIIENSTIYFIKNLVNIFFVPDFITANMNGAVCSKLFSRNHVTHVKNGRG